MSSGQEGDSSINDELFHLYTEYQLCKVRKNRPFLWNVDDTEKNALISILTQCQKINGNTLRLVMKDIFENSVAKYTNSSSSMVVHHTPHMNSSNSRIPQVIVNAAENDDDDADSEASREVTTSAVYTSADHFPDGMDIDFDNAAISRKNILPSSTPRRGRSVTPSRLEPKKEKHKHKEEAAEKQIIRELLTNSNIAEMVQMASQIERTKAMLRKRIYAINNSVLVNPSSTIPNKFSVLSYESCSDTTEKNMYKCQENFIGYRFGKLAERLHQEYPEWEAHCKARQYYNALQRELKRQNKTYYSVPWSLFTCYSNRMVQYVNEFGIYCLFIPEIIAPTKFKRKLFNDLMIILRYVDETCSAFRSIAQVDCEGNIVAPHREKPSVDHIMSKASISGSVLQY